MTNDHTLTPRSGVLHPVDVHAGQQLQRLRKFRGLTQTELGERVGVSMQQIWKYENGKNRMAASTMDALAHALGVLPAYFFDGLDQPEAWGIEEDMAECVKLGRIVQGIESPEVRRGILDLCKTLGG